MSGLLLAVAQGDFYQIQTFFAPETLFKGLPQIAAQFRTQYFDILAFLILAAAGVRGWLSSPQDKLMGIVPALIYGLFVAIIPAALNGIDGGVSDLVSQSGMTDPNTIFTRIVNLSDPFEPSNSGEQGNINALKQASTPEQVAQVQVQQHSFWGIDISREVAFFQSVYQTGTNAASATINKIKAAANFSNDPVGGVGDALRYIFFKILSILSAAVIWALLQACGIIIYVFVSVRYLLIHLESVVLPVFIAMMATQRLNGQGNNYVLGLVGILFWPLGWALGHIGTLALCDWFQGLMAGVLQVPGTANPGYIFNFVVNGTIGATPAPPSPQAMCIAMLIALAGAMIIGIYVLVVTFSAPFLIAKALRSGSGMFGEMIGGTAKGAAGLGAAAAGLAALAMTGGGAAAAAGAGSAQAAAGGTGGGAAVGGSSGGMPVGTNAMAALGNGSSLAQAGGGIGGGGGGSRSLASRATTRAPAGSGGIYAAGESGDVAYIPLSQGEMAAAFSGGGGGSSGGGGKAGGGKSARVSGSSARAYRRVMAMGALQGVLESASQWDGGADFVGHTASRASSGATNQYDRSRRLDRQDFDGDQDSDDEA
jgi:hypothetical protein